MPHQIAYVDPSSADLIALIRADCVKQDGEDRLCLRHSGPGILADSPWTPADCDPSEPIVYAMDADREVQERLERLGILPRSIDALVIDQAKQTAPTPRRNR